MGGHGWENAASSLLISEDVGHFTAQSKMPALHATDWGAKRKAGATSLSGPQEQSSYFFSKGRWGLFWVFIAQNLKKPKTKNPPKAHDITEKSDLLTHKGTWGLEPVNLWGLRILKIPIKGNCGEVQILEIWMVNNFLKNASRPTGLPEEPQERLGSPPRSEHKSIRSLTRMISASLLPETSWEIEQETGD